MTKYSTTSSGEVIKQPTAEDPRGFYITADMPEWEAYQAWLVEGNAPSVIQPVPFDPSPVQAECRRRIYAKASDNSQKNMTANYVAGLMDVHDKAAYKAGVEWIRATQEACRTLIATQDRDFLADSKWPVCPPEAEELAKRY